MKRYHEFLCHLIEHNPTWARVTERALNPVLGKSLVVYGEKVAAVGGQVGEAQPWLSAFSPKSPAS